MAGTAHTNRHIQLLALASQAHIVSLVSRIIRYAKNVLAEEGVVMPAEVQEGKIWPRYADTMIGLKRLDNIQYCVETAIRDDVEGDLIETGVWRGGACIFMRAILRTCAIEGRRVHVADSFAGFPLPDPEKYPADTGDTHYRYNPFLAVSQGEVEQNFARYGLLDDSVVFLKGWFKETLPIAPVKSSQYFVLMATCTAPPRMC